MNKFRFLCFYIYVFMLFSINFLNAQAETDNIHSLKVYKNSVIFANKGNSAIYKAENGNITKIIDGRGSGLYFTINENSNLLGFKVIENNGLQIPCLFNLLTNEKVKLSAPVENCGQVYINNSGTICYSLGNDVKILFNDNSSKTFNIGTYSNITKISNNNQFLTYNDNNDQIWLLNITNGESIQISDNLKGYFNPSFSNTNNYILYQALNGEIYIYDMQNKAVSNIGTGFSPIWANNSDMLAYYTKQIEKEELVNSDIQIYNLSSKSVIKLTTTFDELEADPCFNYNDSKIFYSILNKNQIIEANYTDAKITAKNEFSITEKFADPELPNFETPNSVEALNVPYVHQVYDMPSWHNGHASCAPTTAIMLIAYYKILPFWSVSCVSPYLHTSNYGRYVCERYHYRQIDYNYVATDNGGNATMGGYGFMWSSGSPYSKMADYYRYHGIAATQTEAPPHSEAQTEITNSYPYTMCVGLTSAGHLILGHGLGTEPHTLIFNDPYGNKNTPGYPSYDGQNARYDWPGYNNGYENLNQVYWCIKTKYNFVPVISDTLIDDVNYFNGFYMYNNPPTSMLYWYDRRTGGFKDHFWYLSSNNSLYTDKSYATWKPNLPKEGMYEVQVYIPYSTAKNAIYKLYTKDGLQVVNLDQSAYTSSWVSLGTFAFNAGNTGYLRLGDATDTSGVQIVFDAVKWIYKDTIQVSVEDDFKINTSFEISQNYPNPFNPSTIVNYTIPTNGFLKIQIFNELGELLKVVKDDFVEVGNHSQRIYMDGYPSGHLFINFVFKDNATNQTVSKTVKATLVK